MGLYSNKKIAKVTEPKELTLSGNPNFITFESVGNGAPDKKMEVHISIDSLANHETGLKFIFKEEQTGSEHIFQSTNKPSEVNSNTFLIVADYQNVPGREDITATVQNLLACLRKNAFLRNNFEMFVNPVALKDGIDNGSIIIIRANGYGVQYNFDCSLAYKDAYSKDTPIPGYVYDNISIGIISKGSSSDSIDQGIGNTRIDLDIYNNTQTLLGNDRDGICTKGAFLTTLSKSYFGQPVWFELNALMNKKTGYSQAFLDAGNGWVDTGTVASYRLVARKQSNGNNQVFYYSHPLYVLNGYDALLADNDMQAVAENTEAYTMDFAQDFLQKEFVKVKPLTTMYSHTHIKGQKQYFNFIANNFANQSVSSLVFPYLVLYYRLYTQSGEYITDYTSHRISLASLHTVNTALLDIDRFLPSIKVDGKDRIVGKIEVFLRVLHKDDNYNRSMPPVIISEPMIYRVLPEYLYTINHFSFLNRLGGWDTVNFGGTVSKEFKTTTTTVFKTLKPGASSSSSIETVVSKARSEQIVVQSSPMTYEKVEWLQQMSASAAVYELESKRYVIIDEMTLKYNRKDDLFQVEMKYRYTDSGY